MSLTCRSVLLFTLMQKAGFLMMQLISYKKYSNRETERILGIQMFLEREREWKRIWMINIPVSYITVNHDLCTSFMNKFIYIYSVACMTVSL